MKGETIMRTMTGALSSYHGYCSEENWRCWLVSNHLKTSPRFEEGSRAPSTSLPLSSHWHWTKGLWRVRK